MEGMVIGKRKGKEKGKEGKERMGNERKTKKKWRGEKRREFTIIERKRRE